MGEKLPKLLHSEFKNTKIKFVWIKGPFAKAPKVYNFKNIKVIKNKLDLSRIYSEVDFAYVVFGVTFFEVLNNKIPHVLFFHKSKIENLHLMKTLKELKFNVSSNYGDSIFRLKNLIKNETKSKIQITKLHKLLCFNNRKKIIKNFLEI